MPKKQTGIPLLSAALVALPLVSVGLLARAEEQQPLLVPMRDVDITFKVTRPGETTFTERVRWSANERLERIDGPH